MKYLCLLLAIGGILAISSCKKSADTSTPASYGLLDTGYYTVTSGSIIINSVAINTYSPANAIITVYQSTLGGVTYFELSIMPKDQSTGQFVYWALRFSAPAVKTTSSFQIAEDYGSTNGYYLASNTGSVIISDYNNSSPGALFNASISTNITKSGTSTTAKETANINLQLTKK